MSLAKHEQTCRRRVGDCWPTSPMLCRLEAYCSCRSSLCRFNSARRALLARSSSFRDDMVNVDNTAGREKQGRDVFENTRWCGLRGGDRACPRAAKSKESRGHVAGWARDWELRHENQMFSDCLQLPQPHFSENRATTLSGGRRTARLVYRSYNNSAPSPDLHRVRALSPS